VRGNGVKTEEVAFLIADVHGGTAVEEQRDNRGVHNGALTLVWGLIRETGKVDRARIRTPVEACGEGGHRGEKGCVLVFIHIR
jgi:hypothetical protein